jgi:hypothetical protein
LSIQHHQSPLALRGTEFRKFLAAIDQAVPAGLAVHLVCDNYATHSTPEIRAWLKRHPRFHVHFTPTGSSWEIFPQACKGVT